MTHDRRILVVDDDRDMVRTLCDILALRGWNATPAYSGDDAVQLACVARYPFVLMDIMMPGTDGVSALAAMQTCTPTSKVMLMTAHTAHERLDEAHRRGAFRVLFKPIDIGGLLDLITTT